VRRHVAARAALGRRERQAWQARVTALRAADPERVADWERTQAGVPPTAVEAALPRFDDGDRVATRVASGATLRALADVLPELVGGSADLAGSTNCTLDGGAVQRGDHGGRTIHFGVREHAMAAVLNGLALHGGFRPFGSTFLVFSDYLRPALRLAALMKLPVIFVFTHDSIGVGEDGPTHQPVEQLTALRTIPNLAVLRPADARETALAWRTAMRRTDGPTALVLTRQKLPVLPAPPSGAVDEVGARVVRDTEAAPDVVLVATGSEVSLALAAADGLAEDGVVARVVSMPWRERFFAAPPATSERILPAWVPRVVVEAGTPDLWHGLAGPQGRVIGLDRFGASAPVPEVMDRLGFTPERVRAVVLEVLAGQH
jgi:transketolase